MRMPCYSVALKGKHLLTHVAALNSCALKTAMQRFCFRLKKAAPLPSRDGQKVLDGDLDAFIEASLKQGV